MDKKTDQNRRHTLLIIHLLSAFCYSAFLIFQTNLITQLENNKLQYSLFFITIAFLAAHVIYFKGHPLAGFVRFFQRYMNKTRRNPERMPL